MILLLALACATGLTLVLAGITAPRGTTLIRRVDPYLSGLRGRPSTLLVRSRIKGSGRVARLLAPLLPGRDVELKDRLAAAGSFLTPADFRLEQVTWAMWGLMTVAGVGSLAWIVGMDVDLRAMPVLAVIGMIVGYLARDWELGRAVDRRRRRLVEELPVAIDLLTLSIMSGESVGSACARVADVLGEGIGNEFRSVVADIRAGSPLVEALEGLSRRVPDPSAARLVDALCTAVERGSPLADVLRAQAEDTRETRRRSLLEMGGRREVLMLVPVVFLILPTVVVFALFPGLVSLELLVP